MRRQVRARSRRSIPVRQTAITVLCVALLGTAVFGAAGPAGAELDDPETPGVYIDELPPDAAAAFVAQPSTGVFVGAGTPVIAQRIGDPVVVTSLDDFDGQVSSPSDALRTSVEQYFERTTAELRVLLVESEDAATLTSAISAVTEPVGPALWVVPALGSLSDADYQSVAVALSSAAENSAGVALLDPPDAVVDPLAGSTDPDVSTLTGLAGILRSAVPSPRTTVLYSTPLVASSAGNSSAGDSASGGDGSGGGDNSGAEDGSAQGGTVRIPAAAVMAAEFTAADVAVGPWTAPAGPSHPLGDLEPLYEIGNATNGTLDSAGIDAIRTMPGLGTLAWGSRTLGDVQGQTGYVSTVRTLELIYLSVMNGLENFEFSSNDQETWSQVTAAVSSYLERLWSEGALVGSDASEAYEVLVGVPESMTADDIENGVLKVIPKVALVNPSEFFADEVVLELATS